MPSKRVWTQNLQLYCDFLNLMSDVGIDTHVGVTNRSVLCPCLTNTKCCILIFLHYSLYLIELIGYLEVRIPIITPNCRVRLKGQLLKLTVACKLPLHFKSTSSFKFVRHPGRTLPQSARMITQIDNPLNASSPHSNVNPHNWSATLFVSSVPRLTTDSSWECYGRCRSWATVFYRLSYSLPRMLSSILTCRFISIVLYSQNLLCFPRGSMGANPGKLE